MSNTTSLSPECTGLLDRHSAMRQGRFRWVDRLARRDAIGLDPRYRSTGRQRRIDCLIGFLGPTSQANLVVPSFVNHHIPESGVGLSRHGTADVRLVPGRRTCRDPVVGCQPGRILRRVTQVDRQWHRQTSAPIPPTRLRRNRVNRSTTSGCWAATSRFCPGSALMSYKLLAIDQTPAGGHHSAGLPLDRILHPLRIGHQDAIGPICRHLSREQRHDTHAIEFDTRGGCRSHRSISVGSTST